MNYFEHYLKDIQSLPIKSRYTKEDLLLPQFRIEQNGTLDIYYSPHNEIVNDQGKVVIVGITPGWIQMENAFRTVRMLMDEGREKMEMLEAAKESAQFSGSMRKHLVQMLDELELPAFLSLSEAASLFKGNRKLLHTVSLLKYPVFAGNKNYTGHQPSIKSSPVLMKYARDTLKTDIQPLQNPLIIPLGRAVEDVLLLFIDEGEMDESRCLLGFPHPSGANGHRHRQLKERKEELQQKLTDFFKQ
ncbi:MULTISPECIES: hypothetical protein [Fictibacillus]|uniref:Uracil DNA glycosylase superfamily protein n=1 Tax=Fictibacillus terranigra TaxID=3058424 RepID=A0ABT8EB63_9BACL|nr:hypothetical protein [Fictibacillus sp. CENA-BCM004]MDN4075161.1 hypothetical protein [Fictibacillus sp. CENA-BCM004]